MKTEICEKKALERKSRSYVKKKLHCWTQNLGHQNFFHFIIDITIKIVYFNHLAAIITRNYLFK
jgi:hypothetical protein